VEKARHALEIGACQVINIKPGRLGGFTNSLQVAEAGEEARRPRLGRWDARDRDRESFNVSFASLKLVDYPGDTSPNDKYFAKDIVKNPFAMEAGRIRPNAGPGIGVDLDEGFFARSTVRELEDILAAGRERGVCQAYMPGTEKITRWDL